MVVRIFSLLLFVSSTFAMEAKEIPLYKNSRAPLELRVKDIVSRLTLEEKIGMLSGDASGFATKAIPRLEIPSIQMTDGPLGVRSEQPTTAFPSGISLAATFDPNLVGLTAKSIAREARALGKDMVLGPCIDISRNPFGGRNFESFGEDPYLTSQLTRGYLAGVQSEHVIPSTKHYAMNDQEYKRMTIDVIADERTMQEIHLPAFHAAVNAGTWSIMASYNKVNGDWATENYDLLTRILKKQFGFKGFVVSDWDAVHSTVKAANAGLDLEMPFGAFFGDKLLTAVRSGEVSQANIDDKVTRIFRAMIGSGFFDADPKKRPDPRSVGGAESLAIARKAAEGGLVLLKNDGAANSRLLPLSEKTRSLAVIGAGARYPRIAGGGSSMVSPTKKISPLAELKDRLPETSIQYAIGTRIAGDFDAIPSDLWTVSPNSRQHGVVGEYFSNMDLAGQPILKRVDAEINFDWGWDPPAPGMQSQKYSIRWTGYLTPLETKDYQLAARADDGVRLYIDDKLVIDAWYDHGDAVYTAHAFLQAGKAYKIRYEYYQDTGVALAQLGFSDAKENEMDDAVKLAIKSDVAIVFAGTSSNYESEEVDRLTMNLPEAQDELIQKVATANPNTIVVINAGNPVAMPWLKDVKAVVYAWFPGQEGASALADAIIGKVNPSGKLPVSIPKRWEDAAAFGHYPEDPGMPGQVTYAEGIYVGYRHFDTHNIEPQFPFGFGLSYTSFAYSNLKLGKEFPVTLTFDLTNTGSVPGSEVAQLYVSEEHPIVDRPTQELKAFQKVALLPGETKQVKFTLDDNAFAFYDVSSSKWRVNKGMFQLRVGASSRDIRLQSPLELK